MFGNNKDDHQQIDQHNNSGEPTNNGDHHDDPVANNSGMAPLNTFPSNTSPAYQDHQDQTPDEDPAAEPSSAPVPSNSSPADTNLINLKQEALHQLSPLVEHLEQTAEEKFRTTMMMIQATDDQGLLKSALESAKKITDDKARAQALLDVINEINYFTQQHNS